MALIKCPDCGQTVSDKTITCLKCGRPIASTAEPLSPSPVQTIEKTSKRLKGWLAIWVAAFILSLVLLFAAGGAESIVMAVIGSLLFFASVAGMGVIKWKIWWEHE